MHAFQQRSDFFLSKSRIKLQSPIVTFTCQINVGNSFKDITWQQQYDAECGVHAVNFILTNCFGFDIVDSQDLKDFAVNLSE